jgi:Holliday junction resolvase RusA-like endonuclease
MPPEHRAWMEAATTMLREQREACCPYTGPLLVEMTAVWPYPKKRPSWMPPERWKEERKLGGPLPWYTKPDADNVAKIVLDAAVAAGLLEDDRFVCELSVRKRAEASRAPGIYFSLYPL